MVKGLDQSSFKEHLLLSAGRTKTWSEFVKEIEAIDLAIRNSSGPRPMDLDAFGSSTTGAFKGKCSYCGVEVHKQADCRKKAREQGDKSTKKCTTCGRTGHEMKDCWWNTGKGATAAGQGEGTGKGKKGGGEGKGKKGKD